MKRLAVNATLVMATLAGVLAIWKLRYAVMLFAMSLALAAAVRPTATRLAAWGMPQWLALGLTYFMVLSVLAGVLLLASWPLVNETEVLADLSYRAYQKMLVTWPDGTPMQRLVARHLVPLDEMARAVSGGAWRHAGATLLGFTFSALAAVMDLLIVVVISVYWSADRIHFERLWLSLLPVRSRERARDMWRTLDEELGAYLRSESIQSLWAGMLLGIGYWLIGLPCPTLLGFLGALAWLIPWVGVLIAIGCLLIVSTPVLILAAGQLPVMFAVIYTLLVLLVLEFVVQPRLFHQRRYNPLLIAVTTICAADLWGLPGLLLGPPLAVTLQIIVVHWLRRRSNVGVDGINRGPMPIPQRLRNLREAVSRLEQPSPELISLLNRLGELVGDVEQVQQEQPEGALTQTSLS